MVSKVFPEFPELLQKIVKPKAQIMGTPNL